MGIVGSVWLLVLGVLGAANLIIAKKPDAKQLIDKLAPFQGWIGAVSAVWGLVYTVLSLLNLPHYLKSATGTVLGLVFLLVSLVTFGLGLLLGVGVIKQFVKQPQAVQKMDQLIMKLAPFQGIMGLVALGLAVVSLILPFVLL